VVTRLIQINYYSDFKENFGDIYVEKAEKEKPRNILPEYRRDRFTFQMPVDVFAESLDEKPDAKDKKTNFANGYYFIVNRYRSNLLPPVFTVRIRSAGDYSSFFKMIELSDTGKIILRRDCRDRLMHCEFRFLLDIPEDGIDELLLHNYLVVYMNKSADFSMRMYIISNRTQNNNKETGTKTDEDEDKNNFRIAAYLSSCQNWLKNSVLYNGKLLPFSKKQTEFGKIVPAIQIDEGACKFLRSPMDDDTLNYVLNPSETNKLDVPKQTESYKKLLDACRRCLHAKKFERTTSKNYQNARELLFQSEKFKRQIRDKSFLAVLLFSQYDYYYRSSILNEFKSLLGGRKKGGEKKGKKNHFVIKSSDIFVEQQGEQEYRRYIFSQQMAQKQMNIKSILCYNKKALSLVDQSQDDIGLSTDGIDQMSKEKEIQIHEAIVSELFEAATIAEGLLQLIENAVVHANGGLLSIRIREYISGSTDDKDTNMLKNLYSEYDYIHIKKQAKPDEKDKNKAQDKQVEQENPEAKPGLNEEVKPIAKEETKPEAERKAGKVFFLEIKLSDFSNKDMREKFEENGIRRAKLQEDKEFAAVMDKFIRHHRDPGTGKENVYKMFFAPTEEENELWKEYYQISSNRVHHYGLQAFYSILKSRRGALCISGHHAAFNEDCLQTEEVDEDLPGTSYRIILPLNHEPASNNNLIVDTCADQLMTGDVLDNYRDDKSGDVRITMIRNISLTMEKQQSKEGGKETIKELIIEEIAQSIREQIKFKNSLVVIHLDSLLENLQASAGYSKSDITAETVIKGLLLFLLQLSEGPIPPVAIMDLQPHVLLELTRTIALLYDKRGDTTDAMKKIQIYLRGKSLGDEILFAGSNLSQTADRIRRLALTRGNSAEYTKIAQALLRREKERNSSTGGKKNG